MIEIDPLLAVLAEKLAGGTSFQPSDIDLTQSFAPSVKEVFEKDANLVEEEVIDRSQVTNLSPMYPSEMTVVAIDSTSFCLGHIPEGVVGSLRVSVISKPTGHTCCKLERYGPFLVPITYQNKNALYQKLYKGVYRQSVDFPAADFLTTLDRIRNLLERHIQFEVAKTYSDSLLLLDGSLIGGTVANPMPFVRKIIDNAARNRNSIAAVSKSTGLTLQHSHRSILSLLEGVSGPCYVGSVRNHITQQRERYLGEIYVARLTPRGEVFRIDIPENAPMPHSRILSAISGLAGDYGYPEELKLAHMTCVHSAIEILELQAAAINLHGLVMKEEARSRIFPF